MSHLEKLEDKIQHTFTSGQPGTTGREPFEEDRGEGNPFHREHTHGGHGLKGASETGHHSIGTGSDLIGKSSTGTGNERDINSGEGLRQHEQNPSRVGEGLGQGQGQGLTGTGHHHHTGTGAGATGAVGAGIAGAEHEANKHSGHHNTTGSGLTGQGHHNTTESGLTGQGHHNTGAGAGATGAVGAGIAGAEHEANKHSGHHNTTGSSLTGQGHDSQHTGLAGNTGVGSRSGDYPSTGSGFTSGGTAGGAGITAGTHAHQHGSGTTGSGITGGSGLTGSHHHGTGSDLTTHQHGSGLTGSHSGTTGAAGTLENAARREGGDRTGNLEQDAALYERTGAGGPATSGAAGTDRFDSDRVHGSTHPGATGATDTEYDRTGEHGEGNLSRTSGAGGVLGTSDKDFVGRDRKAGTGALGAYADESGPFKGNTSGPGGNTALTGREGTNPEADNPVARAKSAGQEVGAAPSSASSHPGVAHGVTNELSGKEGQEGTSVANEHGEKKGLLQKIKDAI